MMIAEKYYIYLSSSSTLPESVIDLISNLLSDMMAIPEGKLISSKAKSRLLKWSQSLQSDITSTSSNNNNSNTNNNSRRTEWIVADIHEETGKQLTLMSADVDSSDILEYINVPDTALLERIQVRFETEEEGVTVLVEIDNNGSHRVIDIVEKKEKIKEREKEE
mmetsp:Transcript_3702/g.3839  ORF Transcript_3702/g.3839 Transcript_3702/m.3839 type:complete len:164 (+) Transcript_3702:104-595(+)